MAEIKNIISADTTRLNNGLNESKQAVANYAKEVSGSIMAAGAGFLAAGEIIGRTFEALERFGNIGDLAERFNVSGEAIQRFGHVFEQTGSSAESFAKAMSKMRLAMGDAVDGGEKTTAVFAAAGISVENLKNGTVDSEEAFLKIADVIANTASETDKLNAISAIFGAKLANELLPILDQSSEGLRDLSSGATVLDDELTRTLKSGSDNWKAFKDSIAAGFGVLAAGAIRLVAFVRFIGDAIGIVAAHIASMDFTDMGKDLEDAMVTAADRAFGKIEAKKKGTGGAIVAGEEDKEAVKEADELAKKRAELEDLRAKAELDAMDRADKINALGREYLRLRYEALKVGQDTKEGIDLQIEAEKKLAEMTREKKQADAEAKKAKEDSEKKLAELSKKEAEVGEKNALLGMSKGEKLDTLRVRQSKLFAEAATEKDPEKAAQKRIEAKGMTGEIFNLAKEASKFTAPTVSSLQSVGLGGGIAAPNDRQIAVQEKANDILSEILVAVRAGGNGDSNSPAIE